MSSRFILRILVLAVLFGGVGLAVFQSFSKEPGVLGTGGMAPDFELKTMDGQRVQLSDYRGQAVVLNFWGFWCPPCEEELPHMENVHQEIKDKDAVILAVHIGQAGIPAQRFVEKYGLTFLIPVDENRDVTSLYNIDEIPTTYFIDAEGKIEKRIIGGPMSEETIRTNLLNVMP